MVVPPITSLALICPQKHEENKPDGDIQNTNGCCAVIAVLVLFVLSWVCVEKSTLKKAEHTEIVTRAIL